MASRHHFDGAVGMGSRRRSRNRTNHSNHDPTPAPLFYPRFDGAPLSKEWEAALRGNPSRLYHDHIHCQSRNVVTRWLSGDCRQSPRSADGGREYEYRREGTPLAPLDRRRNAVSNRKTAQAFLKHVLGPCHVHMYQMPEILAPKPRHCSARPARPTGIFTPIANQS